MNTHMTADTQLAPTDAELLDLGHECELDAIAFGRAVLARWGQPAVSGEQVDRADAVNLARNTLTQHDRAITKKGVRVLAEAVLSMDAALTTPQPTQAQAGAVPLTDIRKAALDLYTPPFRHEYGYIRDANHQMVADDAGSEGTGLITSRIRGWGRIQYMDKPEQRAAALQDEVAEIVAEALNAYWSIHGIKGGQHGAK